MLLVHPGINMPLLRCHVPRKQSCTSLLQLCKTLQLLLRLQRSPRASLANMSSFQANLSAPMAVASGLAVSIHFTLFTLHFCLSRFLTLRFLKPFLPSHYPLIYFEPFWGFWQHIVLPIYALYHFLIKQIWTYRFSFIPLLPEFFTLPKATITAYRE